MLVITELIANIGVGVEDPVRLDGDQGDEEEPTTPTREEGLDLEPSNDIVNGVGRVQNDSR